MSDDSAFGTGVIFASVPLQRTGSETPAHRLCALHVVEGKVRDVYPPFLAPNRVNRPAGKVWRGLDPGSRRWWPGALPYRPTSDAGMRRVRRWWHDHRVAASEQELTLGRTGDGRWFVHESSSAGVGWSFPDFGSALAECAARLIDGGWRRVPANYGPRGKLPDEPLHADPA